jgi:glucokinase
MHAIGIDIGGTKIAGGLVDADGKIVREARVPTPSTDPDAIVAAVVSLVEELAVDAEVIGVGVAAAGFVDAARENIVYAPNLSWRNEPFKAKLEAKLEFPVIIENDARAAGWAEFQHGAAKAATHMILLTIGTGVGGAVVSNSQLQRGKFGFAGELGHVRMVPGGLLCGCGQHGCIEQYGSGTALLRNARDLVKSGAPKALRLAELQAAAGELTGKEVYQAISEGDPASLELLAELGSWLGQAIATLCAAIDPEVVVISGGVSEAGDLLLDPIRESYLKHLPAADYRPKLQIVPAKFLNDAGVIGVADLVRVAVS